MEIVPFMKAGDVAFGDTRSDVRSHMQCTPTTFRKAPNSSETDAFDNHGVYVHYDDADKVHFIELFEPSNPIVDDVRMIAKNATEVISTLARKGHKCTRDEIGYDLPSLGIGLVVDDEGLIDCVAVYPKGYYK
jgi:hypothetical protein